MLNFKMLRPLGAIVRKMGVKETLEEFRKLDMEQENAQEALGMKVVELLCDNLERCADDIIALCAAYKGTTIEEMAVQNPITVINELLHEDGLVNFMRPLLERAASKNA